MGTKREKKQKEAKCWQKNVGRLSSNMRSFACFCFFSVFCVVIELFLSDEAN
jgi:hypothetical protein